MNLLNKIKAIFTLAVLIITEGEHIAAGIRAMIDFIKKNKPGVDVDENKKEEGKHG